MDKYAINYSVVFAGYIQINAKSKTDALRQFEQMSDSELIDSYDEIVEVDVHGLDKI